MPVSSKSPFLYDRISLDTETTGLDFWHGVEPFLVTAFLPTGENMTWEWRVDPVSRKVQIPPEQIEEIQDLLSQTRRVVLHNAKFDYHALKKIGIELDWDRVDDTLIAGHLLESNGKHNLTDMCLWYCDLNIRPYEKKLEDACKKARNLCRNKKQGLQHWRIAKKGMEELPSVQGGGNKDKSDQRGSEKDSAWFSDTWLPLEVAIEKGFKPDHPWRTVTADYANLDSGSTLILANRVDQLIDQRGLRKHYEARMKLLPVVVRMEENGVTLSGHRLQKLTEEYQRECEQYKQTCLDLAQKEGFKNLVVPEGNRNQSVQDFLFGHLEVQPVATTESGLPAMDKAAFAEYKATLPPESTAAQFFEALSLRSTRKTAISYLKGYQRFWRRADSWLKGWYRLHPNFNPTGTNTIRFSSSNPNAQNVSKKKGFNLRYPFGPLPGREWWALDYENLELRIPAYAAPEQAMIDLFEKPNEAPFFGSYHMLVFSVLHEQLWAEAIEQHGLDGAAEFVKSDAGYKSTWYSWTKNGNFAVQYGAQESSGTADRAYHVKGAQALIQSRFTNIKRFNEETIRQAVRHGFVTTLPRKNIDPTQGYPLVAARTQYNKILPTTPLSYKVQGTAMECTTSAMIRCEEPLQEWSRRSKNRFFMTLQVHDEIVFDFPRGDRPDTHLVKVRELQRLMELSGEDIGIPLKVSVSYHPETWSESKNWS